MFAAHEVPNPTEVHMERWGTNPFHYGTQSTWPIPANVPSDSLHRIQAHVGRIFFANDAAHDQFLGTTAGTILASEISTARIIGCLLGEDCSEYKPRENSDDKHDVLYGCVKMPKKHGKTRKENAPENNILLP